MISQWYFLSSLEPFVFGVTVMIDTRRKMELKKINKRPDIRQAFFIILLFLFFRCFALVVSQKWSFDHMSLHRRLALLPYWCLNWLNY